MIRSSLLIGLIGLSCLTGCDSNDNSLKHKDSDEKSSVESVKQKGLVTLESLGIELSQTTKDEVGKILKSRNASILDEKTAREYGLKRLGKMCRSAVQDYPVLLGKIGDLSLFFIFNKDEKVMYFSADCYPIDKQSALVDHELGVGSELLKNGKYPKGLGFRRKNRCLAVILRKSDKKHVVYIAADDTMMTLVSNKHLQRSKRGKTATGDLTSKK